MFSFKGSIDLPINILLGNVLKMAVNRPNSKKKNSVFTNGLARANRYDLTPTQFC